MARVLFDTDAVVNVLNLIPETLDIVQMLEASGDWLCTCDVVVSEVFAGTRPEDIPRVRLFFESAEFLTTTFEAAEIAGRWRYDFARRGVSLSSPDVLIASVSAAHQATVLTGNFRHFPMSEVRIMPLRPQA